MSLKEKINDIRNSVVAGMSEVTDKNGDDTRAIKNGKDRYVVQTTRGFEEGVRYGHRRDYDPTIANVAFVSFKTIDNQSNQAVVTLEKREIVEEGDREINLCEIALGGSARWGVKLDDNTDINSVRYQLGKVDEWNGNEAKQLAHFIDKFVIVTPEERKSYKEYAVKMDKQERDALKAQKLKERTQQKAQKAADKQAKEDAAIVKRIKEKFTGK